MVVVVQPARAASAALTPLETAQIASGAMGPNYLARHVADSRFRSSCATTCPRSASASALESCQ